MFLCDHASEVLQRLWVSALDLCSMLQQCYNSIKFLLRGRRFFSSIKQLRVSFFSFHEEISGLRGWMDTCRTLGVGNLGE
jgi:hypothetical protein